MHSSYQFLETQANFRFFVNATVISGDLAQRPHVANKAPVLIPTLKSNSNAPRKRDVPLYHAIAVLSAVGISIDFVGEPKDNTSHVM